MQTEVRAILGHCPLPWGDTDKGRHGGPPHASAVPTPNCTPKRNEPRTQKKLTPKKPSGCLSVHEGISRPRSVHRTERYSALKRKEIRTLAITWMNFENDLLRTRSQSPRNPDRIPVFISNVHRGQVHREKNYIHGFLGLQVWTDWGLGGDGHRMHASFGR